MLVARFEKKIQNQVALCLIGKVEYVYLATFVASYPYFISHNYSDAMVLLLLTIISTTRSIFIVVSK